MIQIEDLEKLIAALEQLITPAAPQPEPRPLLSEAKVGWICKHRNGAYSQLVKYHTVLSLSHPWESSNGILYTVNGSSYHDTAISSNDIISTELLAEVGSAEWAWQMMLLKNRIVHSDWGKYIGHYYIDGGQVCFASASGDTRREARDKSDWITRAGDSGWMVYELVEPAAPQPKVKVGEWVKRTHAKRVSYGKVLKIEKGMLQLHYTTGDTSWAYESDCVAIPRSEVKVSITLEGTVSKSVLQECFRLYIHNDESVCTIKYSTISPSDAAIIRELVETPQGGGE